MYLLWQYIFYKSIFHFKWRRFNFKIKGLVGEAAIHTYTNDTLINSKYIDENKEESTSNNYHHISDFVIDSNNDEKRHIMVRFLKNILKEIIFSSILNLLMIV